MSGRWDRSPVIAGRCRSYSATKRIIDDICTFACRSPGRNRVQVLYFGPEAGQSHSAASVRTPLDVRVCLLQISRLSPKQSASIFWHASCSMGARSLAPRGRNDRTVGVVQNSVCFFAIADRLGRSGRSAILERERSQFLFKLYLRRCSYSAKMARRESSRQTAPTA